MKENILVAYDFTEASDKAVEHALMTAERFGFDVHLVHIIEDSKELEKTERKFKKIPNYDKVICHVRIGDIFEDIVNFSYEIHSKYTVLGIHNLSIWQKYVTGSDVFKILNPKLINEFLSIGPNLTPFQADSLKDNQIRWYLKNRQLQAYDYIKHCNLYEENADQNKRFIKPDEAIKNLFSMEVVPVTRNKKGEIVKVGDTLQKNQTESKDDKVSDELEPIGFFNFQTYVCRLFPKKIKAQDEEDDTDEAVEEEAVEEEAAEEEPTPEPIKKKSGKSKTASAV